MKRIIATLAIVLASVSLFAQNDEHEPGIYAVNGEEYQALSLATGVMSNQGTNILGVEIGKTKISYKGTESGVIAGNTFVLVINPEKKGITRTLKSYNPFVKSMTPANIIIVPLEIVKNKRVYDAGTKLEGFNTERKERIPFEWEQITDNSFQIETEDMIPGEYAVVFKPATLGEYDFTAVFCFTVPAAE